MRLPIVSFDEERMEAVYYLSSKHKCKDNDNRCHYNDFFGVCRCSVKEAEARIYLKKAKETK